MWAGQLVIVGDQRPFDGYADLPVVPDGGVERQEALHDPGPQSGGNSAAVAFEAELVFQRPDDRLDTLAQPVGEIPGFFLVVAGRADERQCQAGAGEELFGVFTGSALVGDDGGARRWAV